MGAGCGVRHRKLADLMKVVGDLADVFLRDHPAEDRRFLGVGVEGQRRFHSEEVRAVEV